MPEWMTTEDVAEDLQCHVETVRRMIRKGQLKGKRFGSVWLIEPSSAKIVIKRLSRLAKNDPTRGQRTA